MMKVGPGSRSHNLAGTWITVSLHPLQLMVDIVLQTMTILTVLKDNSDFSNFIFQKVPKEFARVLVSVLCGRGEDFCLCTRLFWGIVL